MEQFPGNSRKAGQPSQTNDASKPDEPKLERVVTGKVMKRKKPLGRRVLETFFPGDGGVAKYLVQEVLVPALQNLVIDTVTQGIQRAVGGEVRPVGRTIIRGSSGYQTNYNRPTTITRTSSPLSNNSPIRRPASTQSSIELDEIILDSQFAATTIAEKLYEAIEEFNAATVANLKELLGETPSYIDYRYGWTEGAEFHVRRVRINGEEGYLLEVPRPVSVR